VSATQQRGEVNHPANGDKKQMLQKEIRALPFVAQRDRRPQKVVEQA
jgi:hypothetical protein